MSHDGTVPAGKPWYESNAVRALLWTVLYVALGWLATCAVNRAFDWWALLASEVAVLVPLVGQLTRPDVVAPLDALNTANPRRTP